MTKKDGLDRWLEESRQVVKEPRRPAEERQDPKQFERAVPPKKETR